MSMIHPAVAVDVASAATSLTHFAWASDPKYYTILNGIGVATVGGTIAIKFWIYAVSNRLAKKYDSNVLYANALHHRADALSSIAALAGLCGRYIGAPWLDPIGGAVVGYTILKAGYDICKDAMREALDLAVDEKTRLKIITAINNVKSDNFTLEELIARRSGSFIHTIVRMCPPQNASMEDIFVNKDKIDHLLSSMDGVLIYSVEMMNPYQRHHQLLLSGNTVSDHGSVVIDTKSEVAQERVIVPENSDFEESIIPDESKGVEVTIDNNLLEKDVKEMKDTTESQQ